MNCPYCGRRTGDMPTHLEKNRVCREKHTGERIAEMKTILQWEQIMKTILQWEQIKESEK